MILISCVEKRRDALVEGKSVPNIRALGFVLYISFIDWLTSRLTRLNPVAFTWTPLSTNFNKLGKPSLDSPKWSIDTAGRLKIVFQYLVNF